MAITPQLFAPKLLSGSSEPWRIVPWRILVLSLLLSACTATQQPTATMPSSQTTNTEVVPAVQGRQRSQALVRIIESGAQALRAGECQQAINIAERGQRIDRYAPELYLTLAQGYQCLGQQEQSASFARLGLRYAEEGSAAQSQLKALVEGAEP